jgi:hypothetical protein
MKTMPPGETAIINVENKPLPFPNEDQFPFRFPSKDVVFKLPSDVDATIKKCFEEPAIKYVVIDSFTKYLEMLHKQASETRKGFDIWSYYNAQIGAFLDGIKNCGPRLVILTGIDEIVADMQPNGASINNRRLAVMGRQWEGKVEKEFTIVLYADARKVGDKMEYKFLTNTDGVNSAKSPEGMFPQQSIDNDLKLVCDRVREFYKLS